MDIDDLDEESHEGLQYSVNGDGTVVVPANQMTIDELPKEGQGEEPSETNESEPEADGRIIQERSCPRYGQSKRVHQQLEATR